MPTYLVGPSRTYTTIQAAINAVPSNLSGTGVHDIVIDAGVYNTTSSTLISKSNPSASDYVQVRGATSHGGLFSAGVRIVGAMSGAHIVRTTTAYTRLKDFSVTDANGGNGVVTVTNNCLLTNILAYLKTSSNGFQNASTGSTYICCLAYSTASFTTNYPFIGHGDNFYNCQTYGCNSPFNMASGSGIVKNCWSFPKGGAAWSGTFSGSSSNNAGTDTNTPGTGPLHSQTLSSFAFVDAANADFHITDNSVLRSAGTDLSAIFMTDVDGTTILSWMIGFDFLLGSGSVVIGSGMYKMRPWPSCTITPAIQWLQDSAGYWNGSDRGASQDAYEATAVFQGIESNINVLEQELDTYRESITLSNFNTPLFAPNVDHTGSITATVLEIKRNQIQYGGSGHVYELQVTFRAISPTLLSTTPSVATLKVQEGFTAEHSYESPKAFSYNQTAVYGDRRSDIGVFDAEFSQKTAQIQAILAYILTTARSNAVAFPLSSTAYPWGRTRGSATNCKILGFTISRSNLNRWSIRIKFGESP